MTSLESSAKILSLSDRQRAYLRLVGQGMTSKQIALQLGCSHHTVNAEIGFAARTLGAKSRHEAAAALEKAENRPSYEGSYEPVPVAVIPLGTAQAFHDKESNGAVGWNWPLPVATPVRPINTLTPWQCICCVLGSAAGVALLLGGLVSGLATLLTGLTHLM